MTARSSEQNNTAGASCRYTAQVRFSVYLCYCTTPGQSTTLKEALGLQVEQAEVATQRLSSALCRAMQQHDKCICEAALLL